MGLRWWSGRREERDVSTLQWGNKRYGLTRVDIDGMVIHQCKKFGNVSIKRNELLAFPANSRNLSRIGGGGGGGGELYCTHTRARPLDFRNFPPKILKLIPGIDLTRNVGADIVFGVFGSREVGNIRVILALLYINTERGHVAISRT